MRRSPSPTPSLPSPSRSQWRALLAGASLAVLAALSAGADARAQEAQDAAPAQAATPTSASGVPRVEDVIALPEPPPATLLIDQALAAGQAGTPTPAQAEGDTPSQQAQTAVDVVVPLPEPAPTLLVEEAVKPAQPATAAAPEIDIRLPEPPPVTVVVEGIPPQDPVAQALRQHLSAERPAMAGLQQLSRKEREAVSAFYAARQDAPLWLKDGAFTPAARAAMAQLSTAEEDGLDPAAYPLVALPAGASPADAARAELALSAAAYAYARDARGGRVEPTRLSKLLTPPMDVPAPADVLARLAATPDAGQALAAYQPQHEGYRALRRQLAQLRESTAATSARPAIPAGPVLRPGMRDERVPLIRERLGLAPQHDAARHDPTYDEDLADIVADTQRRLGLKATGRFDDQTLRALNGENHASAGPRISAGEIIVNMERWRWLPQDLGAKHIQVNVPDFALELVENDRVVHSSRVVVGKPETPTPIFSQDMQYVVVNPYWNIPPSIMRKEILPGLAKDPDYAARRGYEVIRRNGSVTVRQPPGERNALGFIKFLFPNQHAVYLHDTPSRNLFARDRRAFSHGCVRVDQPFRLAEFLLGAQGYDEARMRGLIGKGERTITLKEKLPVHITYFTVFVDEAGRLQRREDIYGYDGRIRTALGLSPDGSRLATLK